MNALELQTVLKAALYDRLGRLFLIMILAIGVIALVYFWSIQKLSTNTKRKKITAADKSETVKKKKIVYKSTKMQIYFTFSEKFQKF